MAIHYCLEVSDTPHWILIYNSIKMLLIYVFLATYNS